MWQSCSETLLFIATIKSFTLCVALIGNITAAVTSHPSMLQIALGLLAREKRIQQSYASGASASYDGWN